MKNNKITNLSNIKSSKINKAESSSNAKSNIGNFKFFIFINYKMKLALEGIIIIFKILDLIFSFF